MFLASASSLILVFDLTSTNVAIDVNNIVKNTMKNATVELELCIYITTFVV